MAGSLSLLMMVAVALFILALIVMMAVSLPGIIRLLWTKRQWSELKTELQRGENRTIRRMIGSDAFLNRLWLLALFLCLLVVLYAAIVQLVKEVHR